MKHEKTNMVLIKNSYSFFLHFEIFARNIKTMIYFDRNLPIKGLREREFNFGEQINGLVSI